MRRLGSPGPAPTRVMEAPLGRIFGGLVVLVVDGWLAGRVVVVVV